MTAKSPTTLELEDNGTQNLPMLGLEWSFSALENMNQINESDWMFGISGDISESDIWFSGPMS